ncbi:MAG TPA: nucleotidyl transferase AbiEii/AbiGii toxin family protein [Verrucomicrobiae bacterium]|nr:nucleotidyl transferase AbiEii/AbiGii toxin family protein [Verrucomicrobiae bacterium]
MKPPRKYASATAFRVALEDRLKRMAQEEGLDLQRLRRQAAFDRLLCRLFAAPDAPWLLKGGYAMELRLKTARTTRDIDLAMRRLPVASADWDANVPDVLESLREAGNLDLQDFFTFVFGNAMQDLDAAPYGGARFPVDARLAGRTFAKYHLDVSTGDVLREPYETLAGRDWLGFAGIKAATFAAVSPEEQFAEKLHAYTLPRLRRENTRVKDLVDLVLLIERTKLDPARLPNAIRETFQRRKTHDLPSPLPAPAPSWANAFSEMATECKIEPDIGKHFDVVARTVSKLGL